MIKDDHKYKESFHEFCGKKVIEIETKSLISKEKIIITNTSPVDGKEIRCIFEESRFVSKVADTDYNTRCVFTFQHFKKPELEYFFHDEIYSYDLVEEIINSFFSIGKKFSFFTDIGLIENTALYKRFNFIHGDLHGPEVTTLTKITLSSILTGAKINEKPTRKTVVGHNSFIFSHDNVIHPVLTLCFPYSVSNFHRIDINLDPLKRTEQQNNLPVILKNFEDLILKQLDFVLTKNLKIKKADLTKMSLDEKMSYIKVLEMMKF